MGRHEAAAMGAVAGGLINARTAGGQRRHRYRGGRYVIDDTGGRIAPVACLMSNDLRSSKIE